ncbi:MAG: InlB B-repeat-containing protein [Lachnospiraceae bacterium]|nr:InlB B-repeat-containing protein [Lachnospiraceae bacterium]
MRTKMSIAKRFTGIIIALAMIIGTIPGISPIKNVKAALQGVGTSGSPYLIYTADDLVEFAKIVNGQHDTIRKNNAAWAKLKSDIDMTGVNWTPIGTTTPYNGTFDGEGPLLGTVNEIYKIRNLTCSGDYSGLFGLVGTDGIVQNIIIDGGSATGSLRVGGIAGQNNGRIENCRSFQRVDGTECIGGIAGLNNGTINSCYNYGEISGNRYIGGIAGQSLSTATILYCENGGTIRGKADYISGIAGYVTNEIHDCVNNGNVSGDNTVGGIAGMNNGTVNTNENHGNISGKEHIGGIVGYNNINISNCINYGEVSGILNIGGIAGMHSQGEISGSKCSDISKSTGSKSVGNIVGNGSGSIENYYNIKILAEDATYIHGYTSIAPTTTDNQVVLTAIPDPGYEFSSWTNTEHDVLSRLNPSTLTLDRHTTFYMNFVPGTYTVTFHENNGNINSGNVTGYTFGNETDLPTDVTREDYVFDGWFDNENLTGSTITKIADTDYGNKEYWAKWTCNITLDKSPDDGGSVSGGGTYQDGSSVCVTADPTNGYSFVKWTENGTTVSSARSYTFNASGDTDLTAVFEMIPASDPVITGPEELTLQYGYTSGALEVTAVPESGHTITGYQWYQVEDNAGTNPTVITGATSSSYSVPTGLNTGVTKYYYCEVTTKRSDNGLSVTKNSNIAAITVVKASQTAPSTVAAVDESISGKADGRLKGLSAEWR